MSTDLTGPSTSEDDGTVGPPSPTSPVSPAEPPRANGARVAAASGDVGGGPLVSARPRQRRVARFLPALVALLLVLLPAGGAALFSARQAPTYAAVAEVLYHGVFTESSEVIERELATQRVLLVDRGAIDDAARTVRLPAQQVAENVTVELVEGSNVLRLQAEAVDPEVARTITESLLTAYTSAVQGRESSRMTEQQDAVAARMQSLTERMAAIDQRGAAIAAEIGARPAAQPPPAPLAAEQRALESEAQVLRQQIANLEEESLRWSIDNPDAGLATVEVLAAPTVLDEPVGPQPLRAAAGGALIGLVLAFLWVTSVRRRSASDREAVVARP